jgi:hypothetical protein
MALISARSKGRQPTVRAFDRVWKKLFNSRPARKENSMMRLEIINFRTVGDKQIGKALELCRRICPQNCTEGLPGLDFQVYRSAQYESDLSIHIHWNSTIPRSGNKSIFAAVLSSALSDLGLVSCTLWMEAAQ